MKKTTTTSTEWTAADGFENPTVQKETTYTTKSAKVRVITKPEK